MSNFKEMHSKSYTGTFSLGCDLMCAYPNDEFGLSRILVAINNAVIHLHEKSNDFKELHEYRCSVVKGCKNEGMVVMLNSIYKAKDYLVIEVVSTKYPKAYTKRVCVRENKEGKLEVFDDSEIVKATNVSNGEINNLTIEQTIEVLRAGAYPFSADGELHIDLLERMALGTKGLRTKRDLLVFKITEFGGYITVSATLNDTPFLTLFIHFETELT